MRESIIKILKEELYASFGHSDEVMGIEKAASRIEALGEWISIINSLPKPLQYVYVVIENTYNGKVVRSQTMAEYVPPMTVPEVDFMADEFWGEGDYSEEKDEYYTPEGWYEYQSEADINWKISAKVTHWMPLIELR